MKIETIVFTFKALTYKGLCGSQYVLECVLIMLSYESFKKVFNNESQKRLNKFYADSHIRQQFKGYSYICSQWSNKSDSLQDHDDNLKFSVSDGELKAKYTKPAGSAVHTIICL